VIEIYMPHQKGLGTLGIHLGKLYADISLPNREGWGKSWKTILRIFWRYNKGYKHYLYLPSCKHIVKRN